MRLEVRDLTKRYGGTVAVDGLSFSAEPGRVTGFLGRNGAGKSTTMKVAVGLAAPTSGDVVIGGRHYAALDEPIRTVGTLLEHDAYHPARRARDHLRMQAVGAGLPEDRCDEVLALVGLDEVASTRVGAFSLGMRQRLGLAGALLGDPAVLVLDEPGNGLDPQGLRWLRRLLRWRADQGGTVLVSSHQLAEIQVLADDLVVIDQGRLVRSGVVGELTVGRVLVRSPDAAALVGPLRDAGASVEEADDGGLHVAELAAAAVGDLAFQAGVPVHELRDVTVSLEDAFVDLTGGEEGPS